MINNFCDLLNAIGIEIDSKALEKKLEDNRFRRGIRTNKTIIGAFNRLTDEEKKMVVDTMNSTRSAFDSFFGIKSEPWTEDELSGSYVTVETSGYEKPENDKECRCSKDEKCKCDCQKKPEKTIAEILKEEISNGTAIDEIANEVIDRVIGNLSDKNAKPYELNPRAGDNPANVVTTLYNYTNSELVCTNPNLYEMIRQGIISKTGATDVYLAMETVDNKNILTVTVVLE